MVEVMSFDNVFRAVNTVDVETIKRQYQAVCKRESNCSDYEENPIFN